MIDLILPESSDALAQLYLMALCVYREASGEPMEGKVAVAYVIQNRAKRPRWWGRDICSVILHPYQFSSFNSSDPNSARYPKPGDRAWRDCVDAAIKVIKSEVPDPTGGADHYHTKAVAPKWSKGKTPTITIGNHRFFRLEA